MLRTHRRVSIPTWSEQELRGVLADAHRSMDGWLRDALSADRFGTSEQCRGGRQGRDAKHDPR